MQVSTTRTLRRSTVFRAHPSRHRFTGLRSPLTGSSPTLHTTRSIPTAAYYKTPPLLHPAATALRFLRRLPSPHGRYAADIPPWRTRTFWTFAATPHTASHPHGCTCLPHFSPRLIYILPFYALPHGLPGRYRMAIHTCNTCFAHFTTYIHFCLTAFLTTLCTYTSLYCTPVYTAGNAWRTIQLPGDKRAYR